MLIIYNENDGQETLRPPPGLLSKQWIQTTSVYESQWNKFINIQEKYQKLKYIKIIECK